MNLYTEINQKKETLISQRLHREELEKQLSQIINSKFYTSWQKLNKLKRFINPFAYIRYIKSKVNKYKYNLSNFDMPHHDFIILKEETIKWKMDGYEKVGEDWHIKIIRLKDNKTFLLDQPIFYYLQIHKNKDIDVNKELFITYGASLDTIKKMSYVIKKLKL